MDKKKIEDRLTYLLRRKGLTAYQFSKKTGISNATLSRIINKGSKPNENTLKIICKHFSINETWFLTGQGEMLKEQNKNYVPEYSNNAVKEQNTIYGNSDKTIKLLEDKIKLLEENKILMQENKISIEKNNALQEEIIKAKNELIEFLKNQNNSDTESNNQSKSG